MEKEEIYRLIGMLLERIENIEDGKIEKKGLLDDGVYNSFHRYDKNAIFELRCLGYRIPEVLQKGDTELRLCRGCGVPTCRPAGTTIGFKEDSAGTETTKEYWCLGCWEKFCV